MSFEDIRNAFDAIQEAKTAVDHARAQLSQLIHDEFAAGTDTQTIVDESDGRLTMSLVVLILIREYPEQFDTLMLALPEDDGTGLTRAEVAAETILTLRDILERDLGHLVRVPGSISQYGPPKLVLHPPLIKR